MGFFYGGTVRLRLIWAAILAAACSLAPYLKLTSFFWLMEMTLRLENMSWDNSDFLTNLRLAPPDP